MQDDPPQGGGFGEGGRWLPPEPVGPRPDLGTPPPGQPPPPGQGAPPEQSAAPGQPPPQAPSSPQSPAQPASGYAPSTYAPPAGGQPAPEAGNGAAVAALVLGIISLGLLVFTLGFLSLISLACAVPAIFLGRTGRRNVDEGRTARHRGLAQAGFILGIIGTALSVLAIILWAIVIALSEEFQRELEQEFDGGLDQSSMRLVALRVAVPLVRALLA